MGSPPPQFFFGGRTNFFLQKWKKSKLFKITWNGEKISQKRVLDFLAPPQKNWRAYKKNLLKMKKIKVVQNCLKWRENKSKTSFGLLSPPPKKNLEGVQIFFQKWQKSKLFKIAWNGEKISRKRVLDFLAPPPKKIWGAYNKNLSKMKKIKVVQNCLKWREN